MKITRMRTENVPVRAGASHARNCRVTGADEGVDHRGQAEMGPNKNVTLSYGSTKLLLSPGILGEAETEGRMCPPPRDRPVVQPPGSLPTRLGNSDSHPWCRPFKSQEHSVRAGVGGVLRVTAMSPARAVLLHPQTGL